MDDKLLEALKVIKEECKKHDNCKMCALSKSHNECGVNDSSPDEWVLVPRTVYF